MAHLVQRAADRFVFVLLGGVAILAACGGGNGGDSGFANTGATPDGGGGPSGNPPGPLGGQDGGMLAGHVLTAITINPATANLESLNGAAAKQPFTVLAHYDDKSVAPITQAITWTATNAQVGAIDGSGLYTASGSVGGAVALQASYQGQKATAALNVKLHVTANPGNVPASAQVALAAATTKDAQVTWAYPYDGTVFPRGLGSPTMMWNGAAPTDAYFVHVTSPTFELESYVTVPAPAAFAFVESDWQKFVDSTSGSAALKVARWDGTKATVIANQGWTVAPASARGTIYYWANNQGRVMRIKPGATAPDDFSAATFTSATAAGTVPNASCTMTCHTVSADGSTLISGGDSLGGTYNLLTNSLSFDNGGGAGSPQKRRWALPAVSPNGKYMVENSSPLPGPPGASDGMFLSATGARVANSGLDGAHVGMPAFAPDGTSLAYVDVANGALSLYDFNLAQGQVSNARPLVQQGSGQPICWPSITPDANWIVYHRGPNDTRNGNADLFIASAKTPAQEMRLAKLDGDGYPFAAGTRDLSWNFEPTIAPVAAGGYFWVVFTSRRTYGNALTGDKTGVKQLWVAAIDQKITPGQDPSHPPFRLPGQDLASVNMRGFWAMDPCKGDGQGCGSGTECCGGYCDGSGPSGAPVCKSQAPACAQNGDKCQAASDCCGAASGVTCINHVCSEPGPK